MASSSWTTRPSPQKLHFRGRYRLSDEMLSQGTIPQLGGFRSCSVHSKANALEPVIAALTQGQPYRHAIGFEAGERARATKDAQYNTAAPHRVVSAGGVGL